MHYPDRLEHLKLPTLTYRRSRGDVIETHKLLTGKYDQQVALSKTLVPIEGARPTAGRC